MLLDWRPVFTNLVKLTGTWKFLITTNILLPEIILKDNKKPTHPNTFWSNSFLRHSLLLVLIWPETSIFVLQDYRVANNTGNNL